MKKLLYISPNPKSAVSWYRGLGVLNQLRGTEVTDGSNSEQSWNSISQYDIIFLERPCRETDVYIMNYAKMLGKKVWVDFDDLAWEVPKYHPQAFSYRSEAFKNNIKMCIMGADVVTTTNQYLADKIKPMNKNVVIIPNALNDYVFKDFKKYNKNSKDILYRGGPQHMADLDEFSEEITNVIDDKPKYNFHFWGFSPYMIGDFVKNDSNVHWMPQIDIMYYFQKIQDLNPKVVMVPLIKSDFNKAISNIAWIEATLAGAVALVPSYSSSFVVDGALTYGDDSFEVLLIESVKEDLHKYHELSVQTVKDKFLLSVVNEKRYEIVEP